MGLLKFTVRPPVRTFPVRESPLPLGKDERSPPCGTNGAPTGDVDFTCACPVPYRPGRGGPVQAIGGSCQGQSHHAFLLFFLRLRFARQIGVESDQVVLVQLLHQAVQRDARFPTGFDIYV